MNEWLLIGRVVDAHGIKGTLKIKCAESHLDLFAALKKVRLSHNGEESEHAVAGLRTERKILLLDLERISDRDAAEQLIGADVFCLRQETGELQTDQWWIRDLIGMKAFKTDGQYIGTISDVIFTGSNILEIKAADPERREPFLIPFVEELVPKVDLDQRRIEIVDLPGLLE